MGKFLQHLKLLTIHRSIFDGQDKLSVAEATAVPEVDFNQLKEIFTDPDVVRMFEIGGSSDLLDTSIEWAGRIVLGCATIIDANDTFAFVKFLVDDFVMHKIITHPTRDFINEIGYGLTVVINKTQPSQKSEIAGILTKNNFGRIIFGETNPCYVVEALANGLRPKEFDDILTQTKILKYVPPDEDTKRVVVDDGLIKVIAKDALLSAKPHLKEQFQYHFNIDKIDIDVDEKQAYIEQASEIVKIAFSHCEGDYTTNSHSSSFIEKKRFSYIDQNLIDNEIVVCRTRLHWIVFCWPLVWFMFSTTIFIFTLKTRTLENAIIISCLPFLIVLITSVGPSVKFFTSEFGVTNKRLLAKFGFINRKSLEVMLNKTESILVDQSLLGRFLDYGSLVIIGTGATKEKFQRIRAPFDFRKKIQEQISAINES